MAARGLVNVWVLGAMGLLGACDVAAFDAPAEPAIAPLAAPLAAPVGASDTPTRTPPDPVPAVPTTYDSAGCSVTCPTSSCSVAAHSIECPANTVLVLASCACDRTTAIAICTTSSCAKPLGGGGVDGLDALAP